MRVMRPLFALIFLGLGVAIGSLNRGGVTIDFGPVAVHSTLGVSLLAALLLGMLIGGGALVLGRFGAARRVPAEEHTETRPED